MKREIVSKVFIYVVLQLIYIVKPKTPEQGYCGQVVTINTTMNRKIDICWLNFGLEFIKVGYVYLKF